MNRPVDIYCFTGTGNSLVAAQAMRDVFAENSLACRILPLEKADPARINTSHMIGVACPVAVLNTYPLVWKFLEGLPTVDKTPFFLLATMAGSGSLLGPVGDLVESKGFETAGALQLVMPSNFIMREAEEKNAPKLAAAREAARAFAAKLVADQGEWVCIPVIPNMLSWVARTLMATWRWPIARKLCPMKVDAAKCTACGLCERLCPARAITRGADGKPIIGVHCEYCMRCEGFCPSGAISDGWTSSAPYHALPLADLEAFLAQDPQS